MTRVIIGAFVGAIVLFVWGFAYWVFASWVLLPQHELADQDQVRTVLMENAPESGVYWLPAQPHPGDELDAAALEAATEGHAERHREGPLAFIALRRDGAEPMDPSMLIKGFGINFLSVLVAALLLAGARRPSFSSRVLFVFGLGVLVSSSVHLVSWNFMYHPMDFTLFRIGDSLIGWLLVGVVLAVLMKGPGGKKK